MGRAERDNQPNIQKLRQFTIHDWILPTLYHEGRNNISRQERFSEPTHTLGDLWEHHHLQNVFDKALGRRYEQKDMLQRSYNVVSDRWHIERLRRKGDAESIESYKKEIRTNLELNLRERLQVSENIVNYRIKDGQLYSDDFPDTPFIEVLKRGIDYRLHHGTKEAEREGIEGELGGWGKIEAKFTNLDTPIGTKITVFSPPGIVKDSSYDRQVLDEYTLMEEEGKKYVKLTRRIVDFSEKDYALAALSLDPHYFDDYDGRPVDAWYLSHPVEGTLKSASAKGMDTATFEKIYQHPLVQGLIESYIAKVSSEDIGWEDLAKDTAMVFNALLNQVDLLEKGKDVDEIDKNIVYSSPQFINQAIHALGMRTPEQRGGAGCPSNRGYSLFSNKSFVSTVNSSSWYAFPGGKQEKEWFSCSECGWKASGPIGNKPCGGCGFTKEMYSEKYGVVCA